MRRPTHFLLCLALTLLFCASCAEPAQGKDPPRSRGVSSHQIKARDTTRARLWHHRAVERRKPCVRLRWCLGFVSAQRVPSLPRAKASQEAWDRHASRCKALCATFVAQRRSLYRQLSHPRIVNWCDWKPLIWYFWPAGGPAWHCPACGKCGVGTRSQALHTVYHEGGQLNVVDGFAGPFRDCRSTWTHYGFNPLDKVDTVRGNCRVWRAEGWSPWPWWHLK